MRRRVVPFLTIFLLGVHDGTRAEPPVIEPEEPPQYRTIARWYGQMSGQARSYARREPGGFGLALSSPNSVQKTRARVVLREEVDDITGWQHTIVESFSWASSISDLYYENKDGSRAGAGNGGSGFASYSEEQLFGDRVPPSPQQVQDLQRQAQEARASIEDAEREKAEAEADLRQTLTAPLSNELSQPMHQLQQARSQYEALTRNPSVAPRQIDEASVRLEKARVTFDAALKKHSEQVQELYSGRIQRLAKVLQDPKASETEKAKAAKEMQEVSERMGEEMNSLSLVTERLAALERVRSAQTQLEDAQRALSIQKRRWNEAHTQRTPKASADVSIDKNPKSGNQMVSIQFHVDDKKLLEFPIDMIPLKLVGFETQLDRLERTSIVKASMPRTSGISFSGRADMNNPDDPVTIRVSEQDQGGAQGLVGGGEWNTSSTFTRVPVKEQLLVRGQVIHRIRIPKNPDDLNFFWTKTRGLAPAGNGDPHQPVLPEGAIPVAGQVRIEAWLTDETAAIAPTQPPDLVSSTRLDGSFELGVPVVKDKLLRLRFVYHNAEAQLTEYNTVEVSIGDIFSSGTHARPIVQTTICFFRFGKAPKEYLVDSQTSGATVRREGAQTVLEFAGLNSILINSFILKTPYLNQNLQGFSIGKVKVPAARLLAARPGFVSEAKVRSRLGLPPSGEPPEESETEIKIRGTVVCFPTAVTMALAGLRMMDVQPKAVPAEQVRELAQGIYDFHADRSHARTQPPRYPEPPWVFPFPNDPSQINSTIDDAFRGILNRINGSGFDTIDFIRDWYNLSTTKKVYLNWPFVDADNKDLTKQWLISLEEGSYPLVIVTSTGALYDAWIDQFVFRPWQAAEIVKDFLHRDKKYAGKIKVSILDKSDPFQQAQKVLNLLGRGGTAVISIDHLDSERRKGGHIIVLVGVITNQSGSIVRLIVHDPYGDQTRNPGVEGYYNATNSDDTSKYDKDQKESWGAYAPYAPEINSFGGRLYGKYWLTFESPTTLDVQKLRDRLVSSQLSSGSIPTPSQ